MKNLLIILIAITALLKVSAQNPLHRYLKEAAENNPAIMAQFNQYMAALEQIDQQGTLPDPQVALGYFTLPVETRNGPQRARFSLTQMFPWFGTPGVEKSMATAQAQEHFEHFKQKQRELSKAVKTHYYQLYYLHHSRIIIKKHLQLLATLNKVTLVKVETDRAPATDILKITIEIAELKNSLQQLEADIMINEIAFNSLLNRENSPIILTDTLLPAYLPMPRETLADTMIKYNHTLQALAQQQIRNNNQIELASKKGMPVFSVGIDYIVTDRSSNTMIPSQHNGQDAILFPKIGLTLPLYRNKYKALKREAQFQSITSENNYQNRFNTLNTALHKALSDYDQALLEEQTLNDIIQLLSHTIKLSTAHYSTTGMGFDELLSLQRKTLQYNRQQYQVRIQGLIAVAQIILLTGI